MPFHPAASFALVATAALAATHSGSSGATVRAAAVARRPAVDTIYQLAVDSAAYRQYGFVYLLDQETARYDPDGRSTRTFRQVVQILKPTAVQAWAERSISYRPEHEKLVVNWIRVVRPDGEIVSDKPAQMQTSDVPASVRDPVYTQTRVLRYSLANVAPGTIVDVSTTLEGNTPPLPGDLLTSWSVSVAAPAMRSYFSLDVPTSMRPRIVERHLDFRRVETESDGRHLFVWAAQNVRPPVTELFAPDSSVPAMSIRVGSPLKWSDIGRWYHGLSHDRYVLTSALTFIVDSVVRTARTADDTVEALHRWIARDLRYVSVALGTGDYQPRLPEATVTTGFGDCKDKATLFIAAAKHLHITAYPVLLNSRGAADSTLPAVEQFDHVIAAVPHHGVPEFTYLDLTTDEFTGGQLPPSYQGSFGLVVMPDGTSRDITFPRDSGGVSDERFVGELLPDGHVNGKFFLTARGGNVETALRAEYAVPPDSARRANLKRSAPRPFPGATVDSMILPDAANLAVPPTIEVDLSAGEGAKAAGPLMILSLPTIFRGPSQRFRSMPDELTRPGPRRLPIDASRVLGGFTTRRELRLTLPEGWTAQLPAPVSATGPFGLYQAEYRQVGRELVVVHTASGRTGVYPPAALTGLIDWFRAVAKDDPEFIAISKGS